MPLDEIQSVLVAAFQLGARAIVGLKDATQDIHFPLTLLSRAPSYFSNRPPYVLLLDPLDNATDAPDEGLLSDVQISDLVLAAREMTPTGALDRQQFHVLFQRVSGNLSPLASQQMEVRPRFAPCVSPARAVTRKSRVSCARPRNRSTSIACSTSSTGTETGQSRRRSSRSS